MGGTLAGTDSWFNNPASKVSAHFGVGDNGDLHQYVLLSDSAWANGILEPGNRWGEVSTATWPNGVTISIETEDKGDPTLPVSDAEYSGTLDACRLAMAEYQSITVLTSHHVISPQSRSGCCGPRWTQSGRLAQLAAETGLRLVA